MSAAILNHQENIKKNPSKTILEQSSIPLEIRKNLSNQVSKPRTRSQLNSTLILPR